MLVILGLALLQAQTPPAVRQYCLPCHSAAKHLGDLDLESASDLPRHPKVWQKVLEQLALGEMPPKAMPQPPAAEKARLETWIRTGLRQAALAHAGDPGPVVLRRLNNAEYGFTLRDLTGVATLDPAREFPADSAAGEGFMNTGQALVMSPALVSKYLDAAKEVARHAVLGPDGIRFSRYTGARDHTNETLDEIRTFYARFTETGGADTVTQQGVALDKNRGGLIPLEKYLAASLAVRDGRPAPEVASPKYLASLVTLMRSPTPSLLLDPLRQRWRTAKAPDVPALAADIAQWQQTLWKYSTVGHIGKQDGPKAWLEPVVPLVEQQEFRVKLDAPAGADEITLYLAAHDAGQGGPILWKEPRLLIPGRAPIPAADFRALVDSLLARRAAIVASTADSLASRGGDPAWRAFLDLDHRTEPELDPITQRIDKTGDFAFIQGWGGGKQPTLLTNSTDRAVRVPGQMRPYAVAVLPTSTQQAVVAWRSPVTGVAKVDALITPAHAECGNGILWALELRRGPLLRLRLADGARRGTTTLDRLPIREGDLLSLSIDARDGNNSCDLTDLEWRISSGDRQWALRDITSGPLGPWRFGAEAGAGIAPPIPAGSLLARWLLGESAESIGPRLQQMLAGHAPAANTPDGVLHRQLTSLAGPLLASVAPTATGGDLRVDAPGVLEIRLPASLVAGTEFAVTGVAGSAQTGAQLEVVTTRPRPEKGLRPSAAAVRSKDGVWTSNNQVVSVALPVVAAAGSAVWRRYETQFDEFRRHFPASLCYTKIVPVDEVVTMTLFHREDDHLSRLMLGPAERRQLDLLWDRLMFASRAPLLSVDAFEQLYQFATQDADPSKFEPLRQPILDRAKTFRQQLIDAAPRHLASVIAFADRAYRRPLAPKEQDGLRALYAKLREQEIPHDEAIRQTLVRVLSGPEFLYRTEKSLHARQAPVNGFELASRLSYFLWSSQPDHALRQAAANGQLQTTAGLLAQTRRLLRDDRASRLSSEFGAAWLHLTGFESLDEKSERHFPAFASLRAGMYQETLRFFTDFFQHDRSILSLLDADHAFVDEALARHYGLDHVKGSEWRRVEGFKALGRGGLLGQASVLSKQAGASRTSPILRGNWVAEVLLGEKLPRPPKDVPQLPEDEAGLTLTMRELTEKHTSDARCASCHRRIDPYGFALERFDAIGRARDHDLGGRPIQTRTRVLDGSELDGLDGLRHYLLGLRRAAFVRQFNRKLLGYALGRAVQLSDEPLLDAMQAELAPRGYPVSKAIEMIVSSRQFREIRGREETAP